MRVGADYLPRSSEAFPRLIVDRQFRPRLRGAAGVLSRRTATEDGELGVLGQLSWSATDRLRLDGGAFQEFRGSLRPVAGTSYRLGPSLSGSTSYDGQFFSLTASWLEDGREWSLTRTGTGRLSFGLSLGF